MCSRCLEGVQDTVQVWRPVQVDQGVFAVLDEGTGAGAFIAPGTAAALGMRAAPSGTTAPTTAAAPGIPQRQLLPQHPGYSLHLEGLQRQLLPQHSGCLQRLVLRLRLVWTQRPGFSPRTWWDRSARYGLRTWRNEICRGESLFRPSLSAELRIEDGKGETDQASNEQGEDS